MGCIIRIEDLLGGNWQVWIIVTDRVRLEILTRTIVRETIVWARTGGKGLPAEVMSRTCGRRLSIPTATPSCEKIGAPVPPIHFGGVSVSQMETL